MLFAIDVAATGKDNLGIARPVPEPAGGRFPAQQISHFPCEFLETVPVQMGSRPGRRQVAGQHTLGVSDQVWNAGNEDGAWSSEPGADEGCPRSGGCALELRLGRRA